MGANKCLVFFFLKCQRIPLLPDDDDDDDDDDDCFVVAAELITLSTGFFLVTDQCPLSIMVIISTHSPHTQHSWRFLKWLIHLLLCNER